MTDGLHSADQKKLKILDAIIDGKWHSYTHIQRRLGYNFETIKQILRFLELLGFVDTHEESVEESASGRPRYSTRITEQGKEFLIRMKKSNLD